MDLTPSVSALELLVFILSLGGFLVTLTLLPGVVRTLLYVRRRKVNGIYRRLTYSDLREEGGRALRLLGFTVWTGMLMTQPSPMREGAIQVALFISVFLMFVVVQDVVNSLYAAYDRIKNMARMDDEHGGPEKPQDGWDDPTQYDPTGSVGNGLPGASQTLPEDAGGDL